MNTSVTAPLRFLPVVVTATMAFVACGGDGAEAPTPSPVPTAAASPSPAPTEAPAATAEPTPPPAAAEAPHAAPIAVGAGQEAVTENVLSPVLAADGVFNIDPIRLATDAGIVPPSCAELVFYFSWQVRQPFPPDVVDLQFYWSRMGGTELVAQGTSGQASRGCGLIQMVNNSAVEVTVELRYVIARIMA